MKKKRVLFVCIHNSARSQMAEELLKKTAGDLFEVASAGLEPGTLNPVVVQLLKVDEGIDIAGKKTRSVFDLIRQGETFHYVITVCDETAAERCPVFPGASERIHWSFRDPSQFKGNQEEKIAQTRVVKEEIKETILQWLQGFKDDA